VESQLARWREGLEARPAVALEPEALVVAALR
jgi:hypothetical protein